MSETKLTADDRLVMPSHVKRGPPALNTFINSQLEVAAAFFFTTELASRADKTRTEAAKALMQPVDKDDPKRASYEETISRPNIVAKKLAQYRRVHSENLVNNTVNAFNRYLSEAIQTCIIKEPRLLSSEDTVPVRNIIGLSSMKDVIEILVERRINKLSYGSISDISDYIDKHLGIRLFSNSDREAWVKLAIEVRNINVHNGGIVNAIFLDRVRDWRGENFIAGKRHHTDWTLYTTLTANMVRTACEFDDAIAKKFKLVRKKRPIPF